MHIWYTHSSDTLLQVPFFLYYQVTSVKYRNWLNALSQFSQAQLHVSSVSRHTSATTQLIPALCEAAAMVYDAMNLIKVCTVYVTAKDNIMLKYTHIGLSMAFLLMHSLVCL